MNTHTHMHTARLFVRAKRRLNVNTTELARLLDRSTSSISRYVTGERAPPMGLVRELAKLCGYSNVTDFCNDLL